MTTALAPTANVRTDTYQVLPPLNGDEMTRLRDSIRAVGVQVPVLVDEHGAVLDGHHRLMIAAELGIDCPCHTRSNLADHEKRLLAVSLNVDRRQMNSTQLTELGKRIKPDIAERARQRQIALAGIRTSGDLPDNCPEGMGETRDEVAAAVGLGSGKTFERNEKVLDEALALDIVTKEQLAPDRPGDVPPPPDIRDLKKQIKTHQREVRRDENRGLVEHAPTVADIGQTFSTLVIDPPWDWGDEGDIDQFGRARPTYDTMTAVEISDLPVADLAEPNAHLYLWITKRSLPKGFALLERWGFRYVTALTWVKPSIGMGNYFRGQTEHILFGVRGSLPLLRNDRGTVIAAPRPGRHSAKPDAFYDLVQECSPGPWLEMFARSPRPGWSSWGAEA